MNGTETTFKPGSMGSIKDLLRKANERKNEPVSWQSGERGRVGGESPPKEVKVNNVNVTKDGKEDAAVGKENEKATATRNETAAPPSTTKTESTTEAEPTTPTTKKVEEKPAPPKTDDERQPRQKPRIRTSPTTSKPPKEGSFREIEDEIYNFDYRKEKGTRHWIFLPSDVTATLYYAYGDRRVSAVISTILRKYIKTYRDDLRQSIEERSNLFTGHDD